MLKLAAMHLTLLLALGGITTAFADADPTVHQIYAAAEAGHFGQAQQMMNQVLRDHPNSGKAHYIAAQLYARQGNSSMARQELSNAERLEPGLPFAKAESVHELQRELSPAAAVGTPFTSPRRPFPLGTVLIVVILIGALWAMMRRRAAPAAYSQYPGQYPGASPGSPGYMGGPGAGPGMGGSGLMGNLGTGLAIGAGVAAGEELVRHVFDSNHPGGTMLPPENSGFSGAENSDMGGNDFGTSDSSSWDDGGSSGGGDVGGDGWT